MDRTGSKTIVKYAGIWIAAAAVFGAAVFCAALKEERERRMEMAGVFAMHPELEADLAEIYMKKRVSDEEEFNRMAAVMEEKYGYGLYGHVFQNAAWYLWAFFLILETGAAAFLFYRENKKIRQYNDVAVLKLNEILEQLEKFQKGDFLVSDKEPATDRTADGSCQNTIEAIETIETIETIKTIDMIDIIDTMWETLRQLGMYFMVLKERLETEENSTKALITDISHQLKTPIAALRISYELIAEENLTEQERGEFLEQGEQEIHRLEVLLEELVNLSRLECSMIQIRPERADVGQTLMAAVNQVYMKAHGKRIAIQLEKEPALKEPVLIRHDRKWTIEAFVNVLDNAVKYSEGNTGITIRMCRLPQNLLVEVEDEGIGISSKELHRIYQRFYRGEEAKRLVKDGAGVGLYLTRSILEEQGGTITAKRRQGKGTVFRITLPV